MRGNTLLPDLRSFHFADFLTKQLRRTSALSLFNLQRLAEGYVPDIRSRP